jgi:hypothetical protein
MWRKFISQADHEPEIAAEATRAFMDCHSGFPLRDKTCKSGIQSTDDDRREA